MRSITVTKNWEMIVRSCPHCKEKNGAYVFSKESNIGWSWSCYKCGTTTPLMVKEMTVKELRDVMSKNIEVLKVMKKHAEDNQEIPNAHYYSGKLQAYVEMFNFLKGE
jgi:transcription elongation factor Elf1